MKTLGAVYGTVALTLLAFSPGAMAAARADYALPSLATQEVLRDGTLERRIEQLLPSLMRRAGIDVWLLIAREYNDDPVLQTFLPARWPTARRRTILLIHDGGPQELGEHQASQGGARRQAGQALYQVDPGTGRSRASRWCCC